MAGNRPTTTEHQAFSHRVTEIGLRLATQSVQRVIDTCGVPPTPKGREVLARQAHYLLKFSAADWPDHSRPLPGSIAGGDHFALSAIITPDEAYTADGTLRYPGRVTSLRLFYGPPTPDTHTWDAYVCAVRGKPPVILGMSRPLGETGQPITTSFRDLIELSRENDRHYPEVEELQLVRTGLETVAGEVDLRNMLHQCAEFSDSFGMEPERAWFQAQVESILE